MNPTDYPLQFDLKLIRPEGTDSTGLGVYELGKDGLLYTEDVTVFSISRKDSLLYKGKDQIGLSEVELIVPLGREPDQIGDCVEYDNGTIQAPFDFHDLVFKSGLKADC
ncbi:hypothetical protein [Roseibium aggregatum]|uniref:hypothetical protein n=1 Tax=Roseibium aggregatum TaxID=187304 RepID=UPI003A96902C